MSSIMVNLPSSSESSFW